MAGCPETAGRARSGWLVGLIALAGGLAAPMAMPVAGPLAVASPKTASASPLGQGLRAALSNHRADPELRAFYARRDYRPLWIAAGRLRPEARQLVSWLNDAGADGLRPEDYRPRRLAAALAAARNGGPKALERAEIALSQALAAYGADLHRPKPGAEMLYADPAVRPPLGSASAVLETAAQATSLSAGLAAVRRMNPIYEGLREALKAHRSQGTAGARDTELLILANMERARALPANPGRRFVLVDVTSATLWAFEDGQARDSMRVVVGRSSDPTPAMAGVIRYVVFRPYWNVPPDLVRTSVAPKVLQQGLPYLRGQRMEVLSDWTDTARLVNPETIDWRAVADGRTELRVRQRPGPDNMMGRMKFMFPNALGVYLHDTPLKALFEGEQRTNSAGCVRLQDAPRLARWLLGGAAVKAARRAGPPEERADLPAPVPVYLLYLTAMPGPGGVVSPRPDVYGRDAALMATLRGGGNKVVLAIR